MPMKRLLKFDWDVIAGVLAAVIALVLHFLHVAESGAVLAIILVLLALLLLRDLRAESRGHRLGEEVERLHTQLLEIHQFLVPPDAVLIGPHRLRHEFERFALDAHGEMTWYNVCCLMFKRQEIFDATLRVVLENPHVTSLQIISNETERPLWESEVLPKLKLCAAANKMRSPLWRKLPKTISFMLAEVRAHGQMEVLLSFWGEPFMARTIERSVPRYIFRVQKHSELVARLVELERQHRMDGSSTD
jgi:hypothetical protein